MAAVQYDRTLFEAWSLYSASLTITDFRSFLGFRDCDEDPDKDLDVIRGDEELDVNLVARHQ
jgi:hypothetical protein